MSCFISCSVCSWQLAVGSLQFAVCSLQFAVGSWQLSVGSWQLSVISLQFAVGSLQLSVGSWQLAVISWQLAVCSWQDLGEYGVIVEVFYVELEVVAPGDVSVLEFAFPEQDRIKVFVVLGVRMPADEGANVDVLACSVIEHHIDGNVVVANKAYYHKDILAHIFCVILVVQLFSCSVFAWVRDSEFFAYFLDKDVVYFRMSGQGYFSCGHGVDEHAVSSTFPVKDATMLGEIPYEQVPFHANATFL